MRSFQITLPVRGWSEKDMPAKSDWLAVVHAVAAASRTAAINVIFSFMSYYPVAISVAILSKGGAVYRFRCPRFMPAGRAC